MLSSLGPLRQRRCAFVLLLVLASVSCFSPQAGAQDETLANRDIYVIGLVEPLDDDFTKAQLQNGPCGANPTWRYALKKDSARLHVAVAPGQSPKGISLHVYNADGMVVAQYGADDIDPEGGLWTQQVDSSRIIAILCGSPGTDPNDPPLKVVEYSAASPGGTLMSVVGRANFQPIADFYATDAASQNAKVWRAGRSVGKLVFFRNGRQGSCSGFLVSKTLFLTNEHCVHSASDCLTTYVQFGYQEDRTGVPLQKVEEVRCKSLRAVNFDLDFALIELARSLDQWGTVPLSTKAVAPGEKLFIVQHPGGEWKQAVLVDCAVGRVGLPARNPTKKTDFSHSCDTKNGSSGSPVFNLDGEVVGLHHWSVTPDLNLNRAVTIEPISALISLN